MKQIVLATKNPGKLREFKKAFEKLPFEILSLENFGELPDAVENGSTFIENARIKARFFSEILKLPCLADDSGLEVDALNGNPGINSARFAGFHADDGTNNRFLLSELDRVGVSESKADYRCAIVFVDLKGTELIAEGKLDGVIKKIPRGSNGFGYDPYFYIGEKTVAEISIEEKEKISHRGQAIHKIVALLEDYAK